MKICVKTLGCKVNAYESEYIRLYAEKRGYEIVNDNADVYIVNTCTVTNNSDAKSRKIIRKIRRENKKAVLIVMGCFSENKKEEILKDIDADIIIGNKNKSKVLDYLEMYLKDKKKFIFFDKDNTSFEDMELEKFESKTRAFIKIEDGCENFCSYCIIPYVRGPVRSKEKDKVLEEVNNIVNNNHKEIVLTGIHTGHYGSDLKDYDFNDLLNDILKNKKLYRLRTSSIEINELNDKVLSTFKNNTVLARHFHIPLQSGCDKTLKEMNRKYDTKFFMDKVNKIRSIDSDTSITTDVIVGFPNETDEDFEITYNYCKEIGFSKIHVFPYSERSGTASESMDNKVDPITKKKRVDRLLKLSDELEKEFYNKYKDKEVEVLFEEYKNGYYIGHTSNYLKVYVKEKVDLNEVYNVLINDVENNKAYGEIIKKM